MGEFKRSSLLVLPRTVAETLARGLSPGTYFCNEGDRGLEVTIKVVATWPGTVGPDLEFPCGHRNTGTPTKPASYYEDCPICGEYYCDSCNYMTHDCPGCGDSGTHRCNPHQPGEECWL